MYTEREGDWDAGREEHERGGGGEGGGGERGASAWAGKEKTKAVVQETAAKLRAHDPAEKAAADARVHERVREVEAAKQDAMRHNAAAKESANAAAHHPTPIALGTGAAARPLHDGAAGGAAGGRYTPN
ncbi:hypothetical protein ACP70R_049735 [Stipagrostis hirtigluma subsp. patula]